jgi:hypothetical protein
MSSKKLEVKEKCYQPKCNSFIEKKDLIDIYGKERYSEMFDKKIKNVSNSLNSRPEKSKIHNVFYARRQ